MATEPLAQLLEQLCSGNLVVAEQAFRDYEPYLRKAVRRQFPPGLRAKFDSADIVQSVWADILSGFPEAGWRFPTADHLRAFLLKATRNRFIDRVRQHRRALACEKPLLAANLEQAASSSQPRPSEVAEAEDLWEQMLLLCPPEHRQILHLKRQGHALAEIADQTGLHEGSVRRILRTLARRMAFGREGQQALPDPAP